MDRTKTKPHTLHTGLWSALEESVTDIEIVLARADQGVAFLAFLMSLWFMTVKPGLGGPLAVLCVIVFLIASSAHALLIQGRALKLLRVLLPLVEITIPGAAYWLMASLEGPSYALGSWVPPQLFGFFIAASILRLQPFIPALMGVCAAIQFAAITWAFVLPQVRGDGVLLHQVDVQVVRTGSLVLLGLAGTAAVYGIRRIISAATATVRSTELFGKYRLLREIASGGMGIVYEALYCPEGGFERQVAVKLIHPHLARDPGFIESFREEARLSAQLTHPNLVAALDFGQVRDTYFFAMEFVDGPTLWDILSQRRKTGRPAQPGLAALLGAEIAEGVHFMHAVARGTDGQRMHVLHRDLSPANILIDRNGQVKILDFGVARALFETSHIHTANLVGKPSYISPEQLEDHRGDPRSDLWSVAVMLWELLCNDRLFRRDSEAATMMAVVNDPIPPPSSFREDVPPTWDAFFMRALARDPALRFQTALEFQNALRDICEDCGVTDASSLSALGLGARASDSQTPPEDDDIELLDLDE